MIANKGIGLVEFKIYISLKPEHVMDIKIIV